MINLYPISALKDNYIWGICNPRTMQVAIVDPGDATPVIKFLDDHRFTLSSILVTHHHNDHIGGITALLQYASVPVIGPVSEYIPSITLPAIGGSTITLEEQELELNVMAIPGHTLDHIAFYNADYLFCGDTLFAGGCGRIFEGNAAQMFNSLQLLKNLDPRTKVYCAHEYTLNNLRFALLVEPDNLALQQRHENIAQIRELKLPSLPSQIQDELDTNPFFRTSQPQIQAAVREHSKQQLANEVDIFSALRSWKDNF